ncbi:hypothetical protein H5410_045009 [Solanum commersonii]|uniref:Uncharacterized protein n=1 Tax=Solanum commersonii TaxID=4109 RepID=A0A9J5XAA2_SOLCO|nr:hypothetical protein H5410_045009 [Solanum commersonii]
MSLQGYSLIFNVLMENQVVMVVVQNPMFMDQLVLEGMIMEMVIYHCHFWMSSILHPPFNYHFPIMPFFHIPTWESPMNDQFPIMPFFYIPTWVSPLNYQFPIMPFFHIPIWESPLNSQFPIMPYFHIPTWESLLPNPHQILSLIESQTFHFILQNLQDMDPLFCHWMMQGSAQGYPFSPSITPSGSMSSIRSQVPNNIETTSQLPLPLNLVPIQSVNSNTQEIEEALALIRETGTQIGVLKEIKTMTYKEKFDKKIILICPPNLVKCSINIRTLVNPEIGNYVLVLNPTMKNNPNVESMTIRNTPMLTPPNLNRSMNFIVWNCRGGNGPDFRRNFRSLLDCHKPPIVALLETKMQNHQVLLDDFPFNKMIEVPVVGDSGGIVVLWDDNLVELDEIAITEQEIHAMIKGVASPAGGSSDQA